MTGAFYLDWAVVAVSLANATLLVWLGLTVLLNAERRTWGIWLAGCGLLMGGAFFFSHSAILGHGLAFAGRGIDFWWHIGWMLLIALPFAWYVMMLWYAGFWEDGSRREGQLVAGQQRWLIITALLAAGLVFLMILIWSLPPFAEMMQFNVFSSSSVGSMISGLIVLYPLYIVLCSGLSLGVLRRPGPTGRVMGDLARRRARPWLIAASLVLLVVSLLVAGVMGWALLSIGRRSLNDFYNEITVTVAWFDLVVAVLIAVAVISLGQAIVSYEVFTGKTLPRHGFRRYWYWAIVLAVGYGVLVGWTLTLQLRPIYSFSIAALLMVVFYALLSWRSFAERERAIEGLRPFVASQQLYEHLLTRPVPGPFDIDVATPFRALCQDVLGTEVAYLVPWGPLANLAGPALVYPEGWQVAPSAAEAAIQFESPQTLCVSIDPGVHGEAMWAVSLWSERGLIGILLLGGKRDGGLYTQEEIEIARTVGERLIDTQATAEMARRLMTLQRQQLAQSQVIDRQTRRALHDDVLPRLHTALLALSSQPPGTNETLAEAIDLLTDLHRQISALLRQSPAVIGIEVLQQGLIPALRQTVAEELSGAFDEVIWAVQPEAERETQAIPSLTAEVLFYASREAIRNAARHGRDQDTHRPLHLHIAVTWNGELVILIEDDGIGLHPGNQPGEGSGQGLSLHSTMVAIVGGALEVESTPGVCTRVRLTWPQRTGSGASERPIA